MTFQINGANGKYDGKIADASIRYGRNSVDNHVDYMEARLTTDNHAVPPIFDFSTSAEAEEKNLSALEKYLDKNDEYLNALPPLEYEYRYMPVNNIGVVDRKAVLGAALEEMGEKEMSVQDFEEKFILDNELMTAEPLDINKDGKIDVAEYATNIIATDLLSKNTTDPLTADGVVNRKGMNAILEYTKKSNSDAASKLYANIYNTYDLGKGLSEI